MVNSGVKEGNLLNHTELNSSQPRDVKKVCFRLRLWVKIILVLSLFVMMKVEIWKGKMLFCEGKTHWMIHPYAFLSALVRSKLTYIRCALPINLLLFTPLWIRDARKALDQAQPQRKLLKTPFDPMSPEKGHFTSVWERLSHKPWYANFRNQKNL